MMTPLLAKVATFLSLLIAQQCSIRVAAFTIKNNLPVVGNPNRYQDYYSTDCGRNSASSVRWSPVSTQLCSHEFRPVPDGQEGIPIPFVDVEGNNFIECYADAIAKVDGVEYTIGVPCDYAVAICYFDANQQLVPIELNDPMMDDIYPIAESIVEEEFGEELALQRTPQTLTLVGELEEDEDEEEDDDFEEEDSDDDEEVEVLLSFEQDGREYNLVRLLDPILLVGKVDENESQNRILLSPQESDKVMPVLEKMFLDHRLEFDDMIDS